MGAPSLCGGETMTAYEIVTSVFWGGQLLLIDMGLVQMGRASKERMNREDKRHTESMEALKSIMENTAP